MHCIKAKLLLYLVEGLQILQTVYTSYIYIYTIYIHLLFKESAAMYKACIKYMYLSYCSVYIYVWFAILSFTNSHTAGLLRYLQNPNDIAAWFSVTTEVL